MKNPGAARTHFRIFIKKQKKSLFYFIEYSITKSFSKQGYLGSVFVGLLEQNYNLVPFLHYIVCNFFVNSCCQVVQVFSPKFYFSFFFFVCLCVICEFVSRSGVSQSLSNSAELISAVSFGNCPCDNRYNEMPLLETAIFSW